MKQLENNKKEKISMAIVIPVLDDWNSLALLLPLLDRHLPGEELVPEIISVDDGSRLPFDEADFVAPRFENLRKISVLILKRNMGHQRAIALGLSYAAAEVDPDVTIVMDGDGEDHP